MSTTKITIFEHRSKPLLSGSAFIRRMILFSSLSMGSIVLSLGIGMVGYRVFENFSWTDAFLNAAMLMGGMGAVNELHTESGKIFAGFYAMCCGLVVILAVGFLIAPVFHRFLHKFHLETDEANRHMKK